MYVSTVKARKIKRAALVMDGGAGQGGENDRRKVGLTAAGGEVDEGRQNPLSIRLMWM